MAISNGFNEALVIPALTERKGWAQPTVTSFPTLTGDVITNLSGLPYNRDHAACSPVTLYDTQEDPEITDDAFNAYLSDLQTANIMDSLNGVFINSQIIESPICIFSKNFRTDYRPIPNTGKFVGVQISVAEGNYAVKISSLILLMSDACTVKLYCYNDMSMPPLLTKDIAVAAGQSQAIVNVDDWVLNYSDDTHKTGVFFIGYYQQQLEDQDVTALDVYLNSFSSYNMLGYEYFAADSNYTNKTFIRSQYQSNYTTFGLNLEISTYYDYTNTIIRNASQFDRLLGMNMAAKCITEAMNSSRSNSNERISEQQLDFLYKELEGGSGNVGGKGRFGVNIPYAGGLKNKIEREMWRMTQTFLPDDKLCVTIPPVNLRNDRSGYSAMRPDLNYNL